MGNKVKVVYGDMVGDLFHCGHVKFLKRLSEMGNKVVVGVIGDTEAFLYKRKPICTLEERVAVIESCKYVDHVIKNSPLYITREFIEKNNIDLVVHAHNENDNLQDIFFKVPMDMGIFKRIDYTDGISSTELIQRCKKRCGL